MRQGLGLGDSPAESVPTYMYACTLAIMTKRTRDPEGRKRTIIRAASELIMEHGPSAVTHRKVAERAGVPLGSTTQHFKTLEDLIAAALEELGSVLDADVDRLREELAAATDLPRTLARIMCEYLADPAHVRVETVFFAAHTENARIRELASSWQEKMVAELARYFDPAAARAGVTYFNGLTLEVLYQTKVPKEEEIANVITKLAYSGVTHD